GADAIKVGMVHRSEAIEAVARVVESDAPGVPLVLDPVMYAKGGASLLQPEARATLVRRLVPLAVIVTPNIPEAESLGGLEIRGEGDMDRAVKSLLTLGVGAVLLKGGHLEGKMVRDVLATADGVELFESPRIDTPHTHGTGCALSSAIATGLAKGLSLRESVVLARKYVQEAIRRAPGLGRGRGPLGHGHTVGEFAWRC
ncbi:MAG: bifunctional hydroxymethylpyrimidine kinase/phosphomethylpyrimidine kinase, partial [Alphaproteobacteria bacterium]